MFDNREKTTRRGASPGAAMPSTPPDFHPLNTGGGLS